VTNTKKRLTITVNGRPHALEIEPNRTLLELLRDDLGLTGTKEACDTGGCGACTVLLDGRPVYSCLLLALDCQGRQVLTIEGLADGDQLHPLQQAFVDHGAIQCGFCTPGMVLTAHALLEEHLAPTEAEIREAIAGNVCRCTGYAKIVEAIQAASRPSTPPPAH